MRRPFFAVLGGMGTLATESPDVTQLTAGFRQCFA